MTPLARLQRLANLPAARSARLPAARLRGAPRSPAAPRPLSTRTNAAPMATATASAPTMIEALKGLEPASLFKFFGDFTQIPRPSKHEEKILSYLKSFAESRKLEWQQDEVGNLVIRRPGSGGGENAPPVVIQGHVDMVTEKNNDVAHDFFSDPLTLKRDGNWLKATGTTLGADNGIGCAAALALLDMPATATLPPLEALFTVDEETGLTGAFGISGSLLKGRTMLNLDTEDWGEIFIGCAGGGDSAITADVQLQAAPAGLVAMEVKVSGLLGGHSGLNIHEGRGNAVALLGDVTAALLRAVPGAALAQLRGGDKRNAIAREAAAIVLLPEGQQAAAAALVASRASELTAEYGSLEKDMAIGLSPAGGAPAACLAPADAERLLALLTALPHGALKYSHTVPGLVETSNNVASIQPSVELSSGVTAGASVTYKVVTSTRSSLMPALEAVRDRIETVAKLCGASIEKGKAYPGWQPDPSSPLLALTKEVFQEVLGKPPKVSAIHAGLECGILGEKFPGMQTVSFGPDIRGAHSPDERVDVSTIAPFWDVTLKILQRLAQRRA